MKAAIIIGILMLSTFIIGCTQEVTQIDDVSIIKDDAGSTDVSLETTANEIGIDEVDSDLIEFGELI